MNTSVSLGIKLAEERWLGIVQSHLSSLFSDCFLPSHDHSHHQRVWQICKSLLHDLEDHHCQADFDTTKALLLAAWFHDAGMARDPGEKHGIIGKEIFEDFIKGIEGPKPPLYANILDAIANHDSKERQLYGHLKKGEAPGLLNILSVADDLDALGIIGIFRYSEIYLHRGITQEQLGIRILANVKRRFKHIQESFAEFPELIDAYHGKYSEIETFFNRYNQALLLGPEADVLPWGELGIISCIRDFSIEKKIRPEDFWAQPSLTNMGSTVKSYFKRLHKEL